MACFFVTNFPSRHLVVDALFVSPQEHHIILVFNERIMAANSTYESEAPITRDFRMYYKI